MEKGLSAERGFDLVFTSDAVNQDQSNTRLLAPQMETDFGYRLGFLNPPRSDLSLFFEMRHNFCLFLNDYCFMILKGSKYAANLTNE